MYPIPEAIAPCDLDYDVVLFIEEDVAYVCHILLLFFVKIMICQVGGVFEIKNKMVVVIITLSLYCNIPDYVRKHLCKLPAPSTAPVCDTA